MNIYLASSWRNQHQPLAVAYCRSLGHKVYDFKDSEGFSWSEVDPEWKRWDLDRYVTGLHSPRACAGFRRDKEAILESDALILLLPCGKSAHLEAGAAWGLGKPVGIYIPQGMMIEPELMYKFASVVSDDLGEILVILSHEVDGKAKKNATK